MKMSRKQNSISTSLNESDVQFYEFGNVIEETESITVNILIASFH